MRDNSKLEDKIEEKTQQEKDKIKERLKSRMQIPMGKNFGRFFQYVKIFQILVKFRKIGWFFKIYENFMVFSIFLKNFGDFGWFLEF